jgi:hypothetical protein
MFGKIPLRTYPERVGEYGILTPEVDGWTLLWGRGATLSIRSAPMRCWTRSLN